MKEQELTKQDNVELRAMAADLQEQVKQLQAAVEELQKFQEQAERAFLHIASRYFPHGLL